MTTTETKKYRIKVDQPCYYIDHHGKPKKSYCTGKHKHANYTMYEVFGLATMKFEGEVYPSKESVIESMKIELNKLQ